MIGWKNLGESWWILETDHVSRCFGKGLQSDRLVFIHSHWLMVKLSVYAWASFLNWHWLWERSIPIESQICTARNYQIVLARPALRASRFAQAVCGPDRTRVLQRVGLDSPWPTVSSMQHAVTDCDRWRLIKVIWKSIFMPSGVCYIYLLPAHRCPQQGK